MTLVSGEPAELVDPHWLFAHYAASAVAPSEQLVCRLPAGDPWMQNMLRPIVEAAGYRVVTESEDVEADLAILSDASTESPAARTIRLRAEPDPASAKDETIYRYDRAALLMALKSAGGGKR